MYSQRFDVLDSFRGLSALLVITFHMHYVGSFIEAPFFRGAHLFVEFFFVLSGFVLAHGYAFKSNLNFKSFLISRIFRLFPLHLFALTIIILLEFTKLFAYQKGFTFNEIPFTAHQDPMAILPTALLLQAWLPNVETFSWNAPSWSISIEFYMYIIFFISLFLKNILKYSLWATLSIISFITLFLNPNIEMGVARGLSSFFAGTLLYFLFKKTHKKINLHKLYFTFFEITIFTLVIITISSEISYKPLISTSLFLVQIFIFAFQKGHLSDFLKNRLFLYLGKLSYSIYLMHSIILFLILSTYIFIQKVFHISTNKIVDGERFIDLGTPLYNNLAILAVIGSVIFISHFTYKYIEVKAQAIGKRLGSVSQN